MSASVFKYYSTGTAAVAYGDCVVPMGQAYRVVSVTCAFNAAPTTAGAFTVTLDDYQGPVYDVLIYSVDPSAGAITDILWQPEEELMLIGGDALAVAYANPDARNYGITITVKAV
jgi:hypothetical protein